MAKPAVPAVKNKAWVRNPIDAFILAKLEEKKVAPAARADKTTLLRRATLDMTGLPPTPEEVDAFNSDKPYDRFVQEQMAGDELWPENTESWVATALW